jgi:pyridoxamine 5'-phosphate oxidase
MTSGAAQGMSSHAGDLDATLSEALRLLARGVADRRHGFHTPTLASIGLDGAPQARTVVLRAFDASARSLRFHTDARSAKVAELAAEPRASLHFYDSGAQVQIRAAGHVTLHAADALADSAWAGSREMSRMCYGIEPGPGTPIPAPPAAPRDPASGRPVFRAALLHVRRLEWLWLAAAGHQRALFTWDEAGTPASTWLVP